MDLDQVYCSCRKKQSGLMIQCDTCDEWFHSKCAGLRNDTAKILHDWKCFVCSRIEKAFLKNGQNQQLLDFKEKKINEELKKELSNMRKVYQELEIKNERAMNDREELKNKLNDLTILHSELKNKYEDDNLKLKNLTNVHQELKNKYEDDNLKLKNLTNVHQELKNKYEDDNLKLKNLTNVHQKLKNKYEELVNKNRKLKGENETMTKDIKLSQDLKESSLMSDKKKVKRLSLKNNVKTKLSLSQKYVDDSD